MASELKRPSSPPGNDEPSPKRQAKGDASNPAGGDEKQPIPAPAAATILDVCTLRPGDRIEVKWDLHVDVPIETAAAAADDAHDAAAGGSNDDADANASHQNQNQTPAKQQIRMRTTTVTKWWGAVLLPPDGRTHVLTDDGGDFGSSPVPTPKKPADAATVPVRTLDYDAMPSHGFPDRSVEDVVILSDHTLLNMSSGTRAHYRLEGTGWEPSDLEQIGADGLCSADLGEVDGAAALPVAATPSSNDAAASSTSPFVTVNGEEGIRTVLDSVLMKAMTGVSDQLGRLNAAQQRVVAAKIADAKEKLVAKMVEARDGGGSGGGSANDGAGRTVITPEYVKQCMEEVGKEL